MSTKKNLQMMWNRGSANNGDEALAKLDAPDATKIEVTKICADMKRRAETTIDAHQ